LSPAELVRSKQISAVKRGRRSEPRYFEHAGVGRTRARSCCCKPEEADGVKGFGAARQAASLLT